MELSPFPSTVLVSIASQGLYSSETALITTSELEGNRRMLHEGFLETLKGHDPERESPRSHQEVGRAGPVPSRLLAAFRECLEDSAVIRRPLWEGEEDWGLPQEVGEAGESLGVRPYPQLKRLTPRVIPSDCPIFPKSCLCHPQTTSHSFMYL